MLIGDAAYPQYGYNPTLNGPNLTPLRSPEQAYICGYDLPQGPTPGDPYNPPSLGPNYSRGGLSKGRQGPSQDVRADFIGLENYEQVRQTICY